MELNICKMVLEDVISIEKDFSKNFDDFWPVSILKEDIKSKNSYYIVAKSNDEIIGFAGIKIILDEANIMNIAVKINMRNKKIGSILLEQLILLSKKHLCKIITLEVNETNKNAISLYEKYEFSRIGLRKKYYNNTYDAILMEKRI